MEDTLAAPGAATESERGWWLWIFGLFAIRLGLATFVPLGDDEGYYWVWSRHPALSYYDHPPLTAWLVAASTAVFGTSLISLRLPFVILGTLTAVFLRKLLRDCTLDSGLACRTSLLFQIVPVFFGMGLMVLPDVPLLFFWALAGWAIWRGINTGQWKVWLAAGAALGGAFLAKYSAVLLPASAAGFMTLSKRGRLIPKLFISALIGIIFFAPVIVWNAQHHWLSLFFQFVGRHEGSRFDWDRLAVFLGSQAVYLSPLLFFALMAAVLRTGFWKLAGETPGHNYLWWLGAPTLLAFSLVALFADFKPNWPAPAYLTLLPLGYMGFKRWRLRAPRTAKWLYRFLVFSVAFFLAVPAGHLVYPFLPFRQGQDPTADMRGWNEAAAKAAEAGVDLARQDTTRRADVFFAAGRYQLASRLEFYLPGRPAVICLYRGRDAYDDWQDLDTLRGRDFVFVCNDRFPSPPEDYVGLDSSRIYARIATRAGPQVTHTITVYKCWGFKGNKNHD